VGWLPDAAFCWCNLPLFHKVNPPELEVTGSNPVPRASKFNGLAIFR